MRPIWFLLFVLVAAPLDIWLDFTAGVSLPDRKLFIHPFAQAALYLYAAAIASEVIFRVSNVAEHMPVGPQLRLMQIAGFLIIVYIIGDYVQIRRPIMLRGGTIENTIFVQIIVAICAIAISALAYYLTDSRKRRLSRVRR